MSPFRLPTAMMWRSITSTSSALVRDTSCPRHRWVMAVENGKNAAPSIPPWSSLFSSTTHWNGMFDLTAIAFDQSGNGSTPSAGNYDIENAYVTRAFTNHVCDPSRTGCPKDAWDATFALTYPAI